jgi:hypothetical protein
LHDTRAILSNDFEGSSADLTRVSVRRGILVEGNGEAAMREGSEGFSKAFCVVLGDLDTKDAGELTSELGHATLEPFSFVASDGGRQQIN